MKCAEAREMLPAYVTDGDVTLALRRHLSRCGACRTELADYEELLESLGTLEGVAAEPPSELLANLVAIPTRAGRIDHVRTHVARNRKVYLGGAVVAVAGAAGAVVLRRRLATAA